ncbi:MAG TPA: hypothetical protein VG275_05960 [Solirubrobacteraceae bacterium]|nr:hypothetical protein [Solirubrobacteraceae bacterium]
MAFRRARGLLAGEEYLRWLGDRELTPADVDAYLARAAVMAQGDGHLAHAGDELARADPGELARADPAELAATIRAEATLGGHLHRWAERLAHSAAAARGLTAAGGDPPVAAEERIRAFITAAVAHPATGLTADDARERAPRVASLQAADEAFAEAVVTRERIVGCVAEHRLDWQRLVWEEVTFAGEGAAREAALWVREEGMALAEVADLAHAAAEVREAYCADVPELSSLLVAAAPGDLAGPLAAEKGWRLLRLRERTAPALEDPALAERARGIVVRDAIDRHLAGRVRWHDER